MALVEKTVLIEHSAEQMYALVDDVESYTQFLPWCAKAELKYRDDHKTVATLHIDFLSVKSHFTTENAKVFPSQMTIKLVDGPFRRFDGAWHFKPLGAGACKIEFRLVYFGKQSEAAITYILACGYQASTTTAPKQIIE